MRRLSARPESRPEPGTEDDVQLSQAEIEEWLAIFAPKKTKRLVPRVKRDKQVPGQRNKPGDTNGPGRKAKTIFRPAFETLRDVQPLHAQ